MTDREKVIQDLMKACAYFKSSFDDMEGTLACDLMRNWAQSIEEAVSMLVVGTPRVVTWDEISGENRPFVVWIETRHGDTTEPLAFVDGEYVNTDCTLFVELNFENQGDYMADNDNGFRFWTAQPTLAEMEAASWA